MLVQFIASGLISNEFQSLSGLNYVKYKKYSVDLEKIQLWQKICYPLVTN